MNQPPQTETRKGPNILLIGGVGCLSIVVIIILVVVFYVIPDFKGWVVGGIESAITAQIEQSELSPEQKQAVISEVKRVRTDYMNGDITEQQLAEIAQELEVLMPMALAQAATMAYIQPSGLSETEKTEAHATLKRFVHGAFTDRISEVDREQTLNLIMKGENELKSALTDDELRAFLKKAKDVADGAGIEAELPELDVAKVIRDAVEKVKAR